MKRSLHRVFAVTAAVVMSVAMLPVNAFAGMFSDAAQAGPEFVNYIEQLGSLGVVSGQDGKFYPLNNVTRGEFAKMLVGAAKISVNSTGSAKFSDVQEGSTFYVYIQTAANMGMVSGFPDGTFRPNDLVTRGAAAKMLVNAFDFDLNAAGGPHFTDVTPTHDFYGFIETARNKNLLSGYPDGKFRPEGLLIRAHAAKLMSRAMGDLTGAKSFPLIFSDSLFPRGTATIGRSDSIVEVELSRLMSLGEDTGFMYEIWALIDGELVSGGTFNMNDEGEFVNDRFQRLANEFNFGTDLEDGTELFISIEPNDEETPGDTLILAGVLTDGDAELEFPATVAGSYGTVEVRGTNHDEIVISLLNLPDLTDIGMRYEAWAVTSDGMSPLGTFQGEGQGETAKHRVVYKGDFLNDVEKVTISIEPKPDNDTDQYSLKPFDAYVGGTGTGSTDDDDDTTAIDEDVYLGLTTEQTDRSIIERMSMEMDCEEGGEDVIIQAYASAPHVALSSDVAIIVKVSDCEGNPISDLDLMLDQVSGPDGEVEDPQEEGTESGIYIGVYTAPEADEVSSTTSKVVLEVSQDTNSDDTEVPAINVELSVDNTTRVSNAKTMEVDVTNEDYTVDENDSDANTTSGDIIVIVTMLDSSSRGVPGLRNDITLASDDSDLDQQAPDNDEGNAYIYRFDVSDIIGDNDDATRSTTIRDEFRIEAVDDSADPDYLPMLRPDSGDDFDEYQVEVTFIPEDDEA